MQADYQDGIIAIEPRLAGQTVVDIKVDERTPLLQALSFQS